MALEAMCTISTALTRLEAGELGVMSFGENPSLLHPLGAPFSEQSGAEVLQHFSFAQEKTHIGKLLKSATQVCPWSAVESVAPD